KRILRNWVAHRSPPANGRERLLQSASQFSNTPTITRTVLSLLSIPSNFSELSFERFAKSRADHLRMSNAIL
ncbi:MAG: hypothetical protein PVG32_12495, partial [Anaerolineales bacterium]